VETTYGGVRINYLFMCILIFFKNIFWFKVVCKSWCKLVKD
jgi:hypothetical protein